MGACTKVSLAVVVIAALFYAVLPGDMLKGLSSDVVLSGWQIHLAVAGFCISPVPDMLMKAGRGRDIGGDFEFEDDGDIGIPARAHTHTVLELSRPPMWTDISLIIVASF
jgi:hypothetical protein